MEDKAQISHKLVAADSALAVGQGWRLRPSLRKLQRSQSQIMASYYGFLWVVALLNGLRCIVQMLEGFSGEHLVVWNILWMLTRFGALQQLRFAPVAEYLARGCIGKYLYSRISYHLRYRLYSDCFLQGWWSWKCQ